jgi:hypothetical protein
MTTLKMTTLSDLPIEIFHIIVDELDDTWEKAAAIGGNLAYRHDIKQLRQVYRVIEAKTRVRFGYWFHTMCVDITPDGFEHAHLAAEDDIFREKIFSLRVAVRTDQ